ncbi:MAG: tetratricopeptide repeat protein [Myxococcota bacterium]
MTWSRPAWFLAPAVEPDVVPEVAPATFRVSKWRVLAFAVAGTAIGGTLLATGIGNATTVDAPPPPRAQKSAPAPSAPTPSPSEAPSRIENAAPRLSMFQGRFVAPKVRGVGATTSLLRRGFAALEKSRFSVARKLFQRAIAKAPKSADAHFGLALSSYELRRTKEAKKAIGRALHLDPAHPMSNLFAGFLAQERRQPSSARTHYERYLQAEPDGQWATELAVVLESLP